MNLGTVRIARGPGNGIGNSPKVQRELVVEYTSDKHVLQARGLKRLHQSNFNIWGTLLYSP